MAEKKTGAKKPAAKAADIFHVMEGVEDMSRSQMLAALASRSFQATSSVKAYAGAGDDLAVTDMLGELRKAGDEVVGGNLARIERMLVYQAVTLDAVFHNLLQRASRAEYMKNLEVYMRLAMKAQAQARSTSEALALLKNPQPYIRQTNIAAGAQQVNNGSYAIPSSHTRGEDYRTVPNKLLEAQNGERMDTGAQSASGRADQEVEALDAVDRTMHT